MEWGEEDPESSSEPLHLEQKIVMLLRYLLWLDVYYFYLLHLEKILVKVVLLQG